MKRLISFSYENYMYTYIQRKTIQKSGNTIVVIVLVGFMTLAGVVGIIEFFFLFYFLAHRLYIRIITCYYTVEC